MASIWSRFGTKVTILEYGDRIAQTLDDDLSLELTKLLTEQAIEFNFQAAVESVKKLHNNKGEVHFKIKGEDVLNKLECDKVLIAIGRIPNTSNIGLENIGVKFEKDYVVTDGLQSSVKNIFAIGDVTMGLMLVQKAEKDALLVAECIAFIDSRLKSAEKPNLKKYVIPYSTYSH